VGKEPLLKIEKLYISSVTKRSSLRERMTSKRYTEYVLPPAGSVDVTAAEKNVAIVRGIKDQANIPIIEEFMNLTGAALASTRPIIDKPWRPERQVGSSRKKVKTELHITLGISGAFQHIVGMNKSDLITAIKKDPNAPTFGHSNYGIVDDVFKVVPTLKKINELKSQNKRQDIC